MNPQIRQLRELNIGVRLQGGDIELEAPQGLSDELWDHAVRIARNYKRQIIIAVEMEKLCARVGASIENREGKQALIFDPPLKAESLDPERWYDAEELEALFWGLNE